MDILENYLITDLCEIVNEYTTGDINYLNLRNEYNIQVRRVLSGIIQEFNSDCRFKKESPEYIYDHVFRNRTLYGDFICFMKF